MFVRQRAVRAASLPPEKLARITPAKMPMMAMTISSSIKVKPDALQTVWARTPREE